MQKQSKMYLERRSNEQFNKKQWSHLISSWESMTEATRVTTVLEASTKWRDLLILGFWDRHHPWGAYLSGLSSWHSYPGTLECECGDMLLASLYLFFSHFHLHFLPRGIFSASIVPSHPMDALGPSVTQSALSQLVVTWQMPQPSQLPVRRSTWLSRLIAVACLYSRVPGRLC